MPLSLASMTGFARADGSDPRCNWTWEIKSVNGRALDVRCRLAPGVDVLEPEVRALVSKQLKRGNVSVNLQVSRSSGPGTLSVNRDLLDELIGIARDYADTEGVEPPRLDGLLGLRGVIESADDDDSDDIREARAKDMQTTFSEALDALVQSRASEGAALERILIGQLDAMSALVDEASAAAEARPAAVRERMREQLSVLLEADPPVAEDRLAQELAILATKADIREEIDRLVAHVEAAREYISEGGTVGRRLDFLAQEFNREANTLCAKANDKGLTETGISLKAVIDQFREQVQNVE